MTEPRTFTELKELKESGFGRPRPRHGLKLLHWFARKCLNFRKDDTMQLQCKPEDGDYGFELFNNHEKLLPDENLAYYEVGNLRKGSEAEKKLPQSVCKDYPENKDRNMDRIIVGCAGQWVKKVYVTEHIDHETQFNKDATFCISRNLLMKIRDWKLKEFLSETGFSGQNEDTDQESGYSTSQEDANEGVGYSTLGENTNLNTGYSKVKTDPDTSFQIDSNTFMDDTECCSCIIL